MERTELLYTLKEIFSPTLTKVVLATGFAVAGHFYILESAIREAGQTGLVASGDFWLTNLIHALPYLETDNKFLKFLTFFAASYLLVWVLSTAFKALENTQLALVKRLRRKS